MNWQKSRLNVGAIWFRKRSYPPRSTTKTKKLTRRPEPPTSNCNNCRALNKSSHHLAGKSALDLLITAPWSRLAAAALLARRSSTSCRVIRYAFMYSRRRKMPPRFTRDWPRKFCFRNFRARNSTGWSLEPRARSIRSRAPCRGKYRCQITKESFTPACTGR